MSEELRKQLTELVSEAGVAVSNAKQRARLRGESVELTVAGDRISEAAELLASSS